MIIKNYDLGGVKIKVQIDEGVAILTTNNAEVTKNMFKMAQKAGKPVFFEKAQSAMVEKFHGLSALQIALRMDKDFTTALEQQKKASAWARKKK